MIKRELYMKRIRPFIGREIIKVLTGIRRSGKSVMLSLIQEELRKQGVSDEQMISFNFEQLVNRTYCNALALHEEISRRARGKTGKLYFFFDEIQEVEDWQRCINSLRVDFDCDIYVTGSNAKLLSGELATYLAGRYVEFVMYPFSFAEFIAMQQEEGLYLSEGKAFQDYLLTGGMPFLSHLPKEEDAIFQYLRDVYYSVILKDVIGRNAIRDVDLLERIVLYLMANVGHPFSVNSLTKYFKNEKRNASYETVLNYVKACENAFLLYRVKREDLVGKKSLSVNEKLYVVDHGIRQAVYGRNQQDIDQVLENIVCLEMLRRGYAVTVGKYGDKEIDFIAARGKEKLYVQVTYLLASEQTMEREFGVFEEIRDNYPKYVVSLDEFDRGRNGIRHRNIRDFLLEKSWT